RRARRGGDAVVRRWWTTCGPACAAGRGRSKLDVAAAGVELAHDEGEALFAEVGDGRGLEYLGADLAGVAHADVALAGGGGRPAGEGEPGADADAVADGLEDPVAEPFGLGAGGHDAAGVLAPGIDELVAVEDDLVFLAAGQGGAAGVGLGFDGEDAAGADDDVVEVVVGVLGVGGHVVEDVVAVDAERIEDGGDGEFALEGAAQAAAFVECEFEQPGAGTDDADEKEQGGDEGADLAAADGHARKEPEAEG